MKKPSNLDPSDARKKKRITIEGVLYCVVMTIVFVFLLGGTLIALALHLFFPPEL